MTALGREALGDVGIVADSDDPALVDGDGAVLEDAAVIVHRDDVAVPDEKIDGEARGVVHVLCLRPMKLERNTRQTRRAKSRAARALIEGSMPRRMSPQTSTGNVCSLPMLNQVTTNSSSDSAAARSAEPDDRRSGSAGR